MAAESLLPPARADRHPGTLDRLRSRGRGVRRIGHAHHATVVRGDGRCGQQEPATLVVDLTDVEFLGSAGMNALVAAHRTFTSLPRFAVVADGPATSRPLKLIGIDDIIDLYPNLDDALAALPTP